MRHSWRRAILFVPVVASLALPPAGNAADGKATGPRKASPSASPAVRPDTRTLKAAVDNVPSSAFPKRSEALKALAYALLGAGDYEGALSTARDALENARRWKAAAEKPPAWDRTKAGAARTWKSLASLFPYDVDPETFLSAGRPISREVDLHETLRLAETRSRLIGERAAAAKERLRRLAEEIAARKARAAGLRDRLSIGKGKAVEMRGRLRQAAGSLSLTAWGRKNEPERAALLEEAGGKVRRLRERIARAGKEAAEAAGSQDDAVPPEDRRMIFHARQHIGKVESRLNALEGKTALLRTRIWNGWKARYVADVSAVLSGAEKAAGTAEAMAARADRIVDRYRDRQAELLAWNGLLDRIGGKTASERAILGRRRAEVEAVTVRSFSGADRELVSAIVRHERGARYIAARASTDWRIAGAESERGGKPISAARRADLLKEAIAHWEAILPSPGERDGFADEVLYALAELKYEEAQSRFLEKEGSAPDHSVPLALFRRVIAEHPESPYAEPALYGIALSWQESNAVDNAVAAMKDLLARFPGTRYADEIHLRLGECAFDEYRFESAEEAYRNVSGGAPPEIRTTALFKRGWSLFLLGRPGEAADPFLSALLLSPAAAKTGGVAQNSLVMTARSLIEAGRDREAETILAGRNAGAYGPALLLQIQRILDGQNRYEEEAAVADRIGKAYPDAAERLDAEIAAAEALRKAGRDEESHARKGMFHRILGPGSAWQAAAGRAPQESARAVAVSEEGLRTASFYFHGRARENRAADRGKILALYDDYLRLFPSAPKAEEIAYQRAWLLFEDGRKREAGAAFEAVALRPGGTRSEASRYMAVQCAKDISSPADAPSQAEVVRLCREYERFTPAGERIYPVTMDLARALMNLRRFDEAARASDRAASLAGEPSRLRASLRLAGEARFEREDYEAAEKAFRAFLQAAPSPEEAKEAEKWTGFSLFRRAEKLPREKAGEAAELFSRVDREFPFLDIAPVARFRAGSAYAAAGRDAEAIAAFRTLESHGGDPALSLDSIRWLARLYEKTGAPAAAAERYERLAGTPGTSAEEKIKFLLAAADLFSRGKEETRSRKNLLDIAALPDAPPDLRVQSLYRAGESALAEGKADEADRHFEKTISAHRAAPDTLPDIAGKALFRRAEFRFGAYRSLVIAPPLDRTFEAKQASLGECAKMYLEAISLGDADTVSASLHRLGEAFEDFRSAILASPPPKGLSDREREEYAFLLEEKAAPLEEKAVDAYMKNLRQAVAADIFPESVAKSLQRLKALRPARFGKRGEFAFPVMTVPDFRGMIERTVR